MESLEKKIPKKEEVGKKVEEFRITQSPEELVQKSVLTLESRGNSLVMDVPKKIQAIEEVAGLRPQTIEKIKKELGLQDRLDYIYNSINELITSAQSSFKILKLEKETGFVPEEEVRKIHRFPKEERAQKLEEFKEKLLVQKELLAEVQENIIRVIRKVPEMSFKELYDMALDLGEVAEMNEQQKIVTRGVLREYVRKHRAVGEAYYQSASDGDLFEFLFREKPKGKIEVIKGPMTLYFRCENIEDYALIHSNASLYSRSVTQHDITAADMSVGVNVGLSNVPDLDGTIIAENTSGIRKNATSELDAQEWSQGTLVHEEQHVIKKLFKEKEFTTTAPERIESAETDQEFNRAFIDFLRFRRRDAEVLAKDEILAYFKEGRDPQGVFVSLVKPKEHGGLYDYLAEDKKMWLNSQSLSVSRKLILEDIYDNEYRRLLQDSIDALWRFEEAGYPEDKAIAILIHEPLRKWEKVVGRLLGEKAFPTPPPN